MKYTILKSALFLVLSFGVISCGDDWDNHYKDDAYEGADISMMEYLNNNSDLSTFVSMIESSGYDNLLETAQTFTVWAPSNAALEGIDLNDEQLVENIVKNHINRGRLATSGINTGLVKMQSGKNLEVENVGGTYTIGNAEVSEANIPLNDGLAHVLNGYAPYLNNLKEFIGSYEGLDSLKSYIEGYDDYEFDPVNSVVIDITEDGSRIYDSVFIYNNEVLDILDAELYTEDSVYTTIYPNNTAWIEAYDRVKPYHNFITELGGQEYSEYYSRLIVVRDMIFRGKIEEPAAYDSIISTTGNKFYNPSEIFANSDEVEASNGMMYVTDQMPYVDTVSWFKKINVEAEESSSRQNSNSNVYTRYSYHSDLNVSEDSYLYVEPTSTSADPSVTFSINNILSAKYNIYCVFVPESIVNTDTLKTKVTYVLTYINSESGRVRRLRVTPDDNEVKANGLTKMLVTEFDFEFANVPYYNEEEETTATLPVKLEVINDVSDAEANDPELKLTRNMRIDRIVLEPVFE